jgi:hypothetical protein
MNPRTLIESRLHVTLPKFATPAPLAEVPLSGPRRGGQGSKLRGWHVDTATYMPTIIEKRVVEGWILQRLTVELTPAPAAFPFMCGYTLRVEQEKALLIHERLKYVLGSRGLSVPSKLPPDGGLILSLRLEYPYDAEQLRKFRGVLLLKVTLLGEEDRGGERCHAPYDQTPPPGAVGLDLRAACPVCGKRVKVTARGLYVHHNMPGRAENEEDRS